MASAAFDCREPSTATRILPNISPSERFGVQTHTIVHPSCEHSTLARACAERTLHSTSKIGNPVLARHTVAKRQPEVADPFGATPRRSATIGSIHTHDGSRSGEPSIFHAIATARS